VLMATEALLASHHADTGKHWLPKLVDGSAIGTVAFMEGNSGSPMAMPQLSFERGGLHGTKMPVADGMIADFAVLTATDTLTGEFVILLQELSHDKVKRTPVQTVDLVRKHARLDFNGCTPTVLATGVAAENLRDQILHSSAILLAFEGLGSAEAAMEMAVGYAKERVAFGRQIGSYQAVKHKCADMYIKNQLARSHAYFGAWALSTHAPELAQAASGARLAALDALRFAAEENVQLYGGIGFTWESDCQFFYRRSRLLALSLGSRAFWSDRLVRTLEQRNTLAA
jgi:acyl-CoA dehydrogenase